jgi:hypothetical protein
MLISSGFATTIAVFLHTLKFRKMIGPRTSFIIYAASYLSTFYSYFYIYDIFGKNMDLTLLVLGGVILNFTHLRYQIAYQVGVFSLLMYTRYGMLPNSISNIFS